MARLHMFCAEAAAGGVSWDRFSPSLSHQATTASRSTLPDVPRIRVTRQSAVADAPKRRRSGCATVLLVEYSCLMSTVRGAPLQMPFQPATTRTLSWSEQFYRIEDRGRFPSAESRRRRYTIVKAEDTSTSTQAADSNFDKKREYFLPTSLEESIDQARTAAREAIRDGVKRIQLEVPLPLIGATDLDDWPGGIQQQYKAAGPVIKSLLTGLVDGESFKEGGGYRKSVIDEGDAVVVWESDKVALVLFPTAETLPTIEALAKEEERPLLIVNAQWQGGQIVSDFGFGSKRRAREEFVASFEVVYLLKPIRIRGEDVRLLRRYPGEWQIFVLDSTGTANRSVAAVPERPSYKELETILRSRKGSKADRGWFARLFSELEFNQKSLKE